MNTIQNTKSLQGKNKRKEEEKEKSVDVELEEELGILRKILSDLFRAEAKKSNHPLSHLDVLAFVTDKGNPSMKDIADYLMVTPPSATVLVNSMIQQRLLSRVANPSDRRTVRIKITAQGATLIRKLKTKKKIIIHSLFDSLNVAEKKQFIGLIKKIAKR